MEELMKQYTVNYLKDFPSKELADKAYDIADAMLERRKLNSKTKG